MVTSNINNKLKEKAPHSKFDILLEKNTMNLLLLKNIEIIKATFYVNCENIALLFYFFILKEGKNVFNATYFAPKNRKNTVSNSRFSGKENQSELLDGFVTVTILKLNPVQYYFIIDNYFKIKLENYRYYKITLERKSIEK